MFQRNDSYRAANNKTTATPKLGADVARAQQVMPMRMLIKSPSTGVAPAKMRSLSALGAAGAVAAGAVASGPLAPLNGPLNARPAPARVQRPSPSTPVNPNVHGRRNYGGPRVLLGPQKIPAGSDSSLNRSGGDLSAMRIEPMRSPAPNAVVRPPTSAQDRPSFFTSGNTEIW